MRGFKSHNGKRIAKVCKTPCVCCHVSLQNDTRSSGHSLPIITALRFFWLVALVEASDDERFCHLCSASHSKALKIERLMMSNLACRINVFPTLMTERASKPLTGHFSRVTMIV
jgi:hypothetical protein